MEYARKHKENKAVSMTILQFIVTYFASWWLVLLMVLPFGVTIAARPQPGHAPSAPERPHLKRKFLIATLLAFIPTLVIYSVVDAKAASGIYHAGPNDCAKDPNHRTPADIEATDNNATLNPHPIAGMDNMPVLLDIPAAPYLNLEDEESNPNVDLRQSDVWVGVAEVKKDGSISLNGSPMNNSPADKRCK